MVFNRLSNVSLLLGIVKTIYYCWFTVILTVHIKKYMQSIIGIMSKHTSTMKHLNYDWIL